MFGLPAATAVAIFGVAGFWVVYTIVFLIISRGWEREDVDEPTGASGAAPGPAPGPAPGAGRTAPGGGAA